ncbi:hypothetical protein [Neisseria musculi]|uniref:Membrane protein n=1 Tax=Neisseria musculi TaxID=1815583 RepID=A0A7H1MFH7_9NEIS|nr:hypothetical protein [Neisseria musculi]QNT60392.1 putative membrane protein [Neisseria musculi]
MDHNDVRKGILQAKLIEDTSGLLWAEMLFAPLLLAVTAERLDIFPDPTGGLLVFLGVGFFSFVFFLWCSWHSRPRFWMAVFFSCIWAYAFWWLFGLISDDKPFSEYPSLSHFLVYYGLRSIPSVIIFIITMIAHFSDFQWMDDVSS